MTSIVITGANQGIGYYFVEKSLKDGCNVGVIDIEVDNLKELKKKFPNNLIYFKTDVCNEVSMQGAVTEIINHFSTIDIAIHNACLCTFGQEIDTDFDVYQKVFDVNYYGGLRLAKCILPHMRSRKSGKVIFTSSGVGVTGFIGISPYASSKAALETLAKCLNLKYSKDNVSFHIIHPPLTRTKSAAPLPVPKEFMSDPQKVGYGLVKHIMSKRFIICHSFGQKLQTLACYLFPIKMGQLLSKMTSNYVGKEGKQNESS